jgi:hypothetical protein
MLLVCAKTKAKQFYFDLIAMKRSLLLITFLVMFSFSAMTATGATLTVFSSADSGAGTLRQAIFDASSGDTIKFAIPSPFPGSPPPEIRVSSELVINKSLTIEGPTGAERLTVRPNISYCGGGNTFRVFRVGPAGVTVTISGLTVSGSSFSCSFPGPGGGVVNSGTLILDSCMVSNNSAQGNGY